MTNPLPHHLFGGGFFIVYTSYLKTHTPYIENTLLQ